MMIEVMMVQQLPNQPYRRWFMDTKHDLIVWYDDNRQDLLGFQFCYDKGKNEHAVTVLPGGAVRHHQVDDGETRKSRKGTTILGPAHMTPMLMAADQKRLIDVAGRFLANSKDLEDGIVEFVHGHLVKLSSASIATRSDR